MQGSARPCEGSSTTAKAAAANDVNVGMLKKKKTKKQKQKQKQKQKNGVHHPLFFFLFFNTKQYHNIYRQKKHNHSTQLTCELVLSGSRKRKERRIEGKKRSTIADFWRAKNDASLFDDCNNNHSRPIF